MDRFGAEFFARAGFAGDKNRGPRLRYVLDRAVDRIHRSRRPYETLKARAPRLGFDLFLQGGQFQRVTNRD